MQNVKIGLTMALGVIVGAMLGLTAPSNAAATKTPPAFTYAGCQLTLHPSPAHNNYGSVVVKAGSSSVDVVKRVNGKWNSTTRVSAGQARQFSVATPNTTKTTSFQLRVGGVYQGPALETGKGMCIAE